MDAPANADLAVATRTPGTVPIPLLFVTLGAALTGILILSRAPFGASVAAATMIAVNICAFGWIWTTLLARQVDLAEFIGVGVGGAFIGPTVGYLIFSLVSPPLPSLGLAWCAWLVGPGAALTAWLVLRGQRTPSRPPRLTPWTLVAGTAAVFGALALMRWQFDRYDLTPPVDITSFHPDMIWFQAMSVANSLGDLGQNGVMAGWSVRYHWFSFAWVGTLEGALGLPPFLAITRVLPILAVVGMAFLAAAVAHRLTRIVWLPVVAALAVTSGRLPLDSTGLNLNWDSPSQTASTVLLLLGFLIAVVLPRTQHPRALVLVLVVLVAVLSGFKISAALVFVSALLLAAVVGLARRSPWRRRILTAALLAALVTATIYALVLAGQENSWAVRPRWDQGAGTWLDLNGMALATTLAVVPSVTSAIYLLWTRQRHTPAPWLGAGALVAGLAPLWLLAEAGPNNRWFLTSALAVLWVLGAIGVDGAFSSSHLTGRRTQTALVISASAATLGALAVWGAILTYSSLNTVAATGLVVVLLASASLIVTLFLGKSRRGLLIPVMLLTGLLSTLGVVVVERALPATAPRAGAATSMPDTSRTDLVGPSGSASIVNPTEFAELSALLAAKAEPGDQVAIFDDGLLASLAAARAIPFVALGGYAMNIGPEGSSAEFSRRIAVLEASRTNPAVLCAEGVDWLVPDSGGRPELVRLPCGERGAS